MKRMILSCLTLSSWVIAWGQTATDMQVLQRAFAPPGTVKLTEKYTESKQNRNELQLVLSGLFLTYKTVVSSQDQNRCSFTPSCSEYGLLAVKQMGVLKGGISTFDRLLRCNGLNAKNYEFDLKTLHLKDPPAW